MKKGFTLTEILTVVVILSVLAAIAIPGFNKAKNKAAADQAIAYLRTIRTSQKMYAAKWGNYLARGSSAAIKAELGAETKTKDYTFAVTVTVPPAAPAFTATATSSRGTITINQDGTWGATGSEKAPAS